MVEKKQVEKKQAPEMTTTGRGGGGGGRDRADENHTTSTSRVLFFQSFLFSFPSLSLAFSLCRGLCLGPGPVPGPSCLGSSSVPQGFLCLSACLSLPCPRALVTLCLLWSDWDDTLRKEKERERERER